jgi:hypothetical protein
MRPGRAVHGRRQRIERERALLPGLPAASLHPLVTGCVAIWETFGLSGRAPGFLARPLILARTKQYLLCFSIREMVALVYLKSPLNFIPPG